MDKFLSLFESGKKIEYNNLNIKYNTEQLEFIKYALEDCKLLGIPGGGKTQSIIGKVIHHFKNNDINSNNNFIILTFSRRACNDFIEKGKKQNRKFFNSKNICTLHSLAGKIVYKVLEKRSSSQDTVIISSIDLIDDHETSILEMPQFSHLKVIFVDEAQDISEIQYKFIMKISELTHCKVIMIGDPNKNIYQFQKGNDTYLLNHPGKTFLLIKNYRSTPHIVNFVNSFRPWENITAQMVSTKSNDDPFNKKPNIFLGTIDEIIQNVCDKILNSPFSKEEIAIIGPVKKSKPTQDSYTNIGLSLFTNLLNNYGINYTKHYEDTNNNEDTLCEFKKVKDHVNLFTIHGSKGLEFHQVFLLNFHTSTFGIIPTEEKYREFKYLWYVGLSRASFDLNIYIDKNKMPWNELKNCPQELYNNESLKLQFARELKFQEEIVPMYNTVTEILNSKKFMDDDLLFKLENIFKYDIETVPIFSSKEEESPLKKITNYKEYCMLYGMFIENIFNYYYMLNFSSIADFVLKLKKIINNTIIVPKEYISGYKILKIRCPFIKKNLIKLADFNIIKNQFRKSEEELYSYLCESFEYNYHKEFFIDCENDVINYSKDDLLESIDYLEHINNLNKDESIRHIFNITLYYYQQSHETAYLWKVDFSQELADLDYYINEVIQFANSVEEDFRFHPMFNHPKLSIVGELDMMSKTKIVDIKFSNNLNVKHILQVLLYNHLIDPSFIKKYELELWNFHLGNVYKIKLNYDKLDIYSLLKILSKSINKKLENMIFLYDLETTGFAYANKKMDILERYFEEFSTGIVPSSGLLKPVDVPFIPFEITALTGITKDMLYERGDHIQRFKNEMDELFKYCKMPIFVAHNGNSFDHKILLEKNILSYDNCKFLDSRMIIRLFLDDPVSGKSLSDIFKHLFKFLPVAHRAQTDVKMMISIFQKLGINEEKILRMV